MTSAIQKWGCIAGSVTAAICVAAEETPGQWREVGKSGALGCGAAVYSPTRKQILRWGEFSDRNGVWAFDAQKFEWSADYEPDKAAFGGTFVWDPHHGVFVYVGGVRGNMWRARTLLLKPDFDKVQWQGP